MAMQHLENELRRTGDPRKQAFADVIAGIHKSLGSDIPFPSIATPEAVKAYPEISLEEEWQRQAQRFVELGFHIELGLAEDQYLESLPKFTAQPENFKERLNTPVLVETRISPKRQSEVAGIQYLLDGLNVKDWGEDPKKYKTPDFAYTVWTDEGERFMNRKVQDVRKELALDERGGTEFDGIAFFIAKHGVLQTRFLDLPGTSVGSGGAAYLNLWSDRPGLRYGFVDLALPEFGSLVCGR